jgi:hypothetical protein
LLDILYLGSKVLNSVATAALSIIDAAISVLLPNSLASPLRLFLYLSLLLLELPLFVPPSKMEKSPTRLKMFQATTPSDGLQAVLLFKLGAF